MYSCYLRINAWMSARRLGWESVSAIYFPKSMEYVAARPGIIIAGGAWVALDDMIGKECRDFVIRDSGCQVVFDQEKWEEVMKLKEGPEIADSGLHDLAFILYTSGNTGTPKGIEQEYGLYDYIVKCVRNFFVPHGEIVFTEVAPQTFLSGPFYSIGCSASRANCTRSPRLWPATPCSGSVFRPAEDYRLVSAAYAAPGHHSGPD